MADYLIDPKTIDYDNLPPLVAKGEDREEVIGALVEAWCTPIERKAKRDESPGVTLNMVALVDANTGQPVDLGELLRRVEDRLRSDGEEQGYRFRQDLRIVIRGCRVDACSCDNCVVRPQLICSCTKFCDGSSFRNARLGTHASFRRAIMGDRASFADATLDDGADFGGATIGDHASFAGSRLGRSTSFMSTTLGEYSNFRSAVLGNHANFHSAKLGGGTSFEYARLGHGANFASATLGNRVNLEYMKLNGVVRLARAGLADSSLMSCDLRHADIGEATFGRRLPPPGWRRLWWMLHSLYSHWFSWRLVRGVGELAVLTRVSYIALLVVPLLAGAWPAVRATIDAWANTTRDSELQSANMPSQWALVFFAAAAVGLGHLVYQLGAPQLIKEMSREDVVRERMARFREHYKQERTEILRSAVSKLADVARVLPYDRHPNLVKHHGETVWIPSDLDWFEDPEPVIDDDHIYPDTDLSSVSSLDREAITVEEGARAEYDCAAHENLGAAWGSFVFYAIGALLLGWLFWDQSLVIAGQAGWNGLKSLLRFAPYALFWPITLLLITASVLIAFTDIVLKPESRPMKGIGLVTS